MAEDTDAIDAILAGMQQWTPEERSKYCDDVGEHPLFMSKAPTMEEAEGNAYMGALTHMVYDEEDTPEGMARECKEKGNAAFTKGAAYYGHAIKHYNDAIDHASRIPSKAPAALKAEMTALTSACWSNLAAIHLARGKYVTTLQACEAALKASPKNVKALYRAAKACLPTGRAEAALAFTKLAIEADPAGDRNAALAALLKECNEARRVQIAAAEAAKKLYQERAASLARVRAAVKERGINVGPPLFRGMRRTLAEPKVEGYGDSQVLVWPVLILYPAAGHSDYCEAVSEVASVASVLEQVLPLGDAKTSSRKRGSSRGPVPPPLWDIRGEYCLSNVDVFYKANPCAPIPVERWGRVAMTGAGAAAELLNGTAAGKGDGPALLDEASGAAAASSIDDYEEPKESVLRSRWVRVPPAAPLLLPLVQPNYVVADIPVLYVVPRSSACYADMLAGSGGAFLELNVPELPPEPEDDEEEDDE